MKRVLIALLGLIFQIHLFGVEEEVILSLDIISYEDFVRQDPDAIAILKRALYEKGIVGIRGIPGYMDKVTRFIDTAKEFSSLPENVKEQYAPQHDAGDMFLGYERGKEKFQRPDGQWVVDDIKVSYYGFVPDSDCNKWPREINLRTPFQDLGMLMSDVGQAVMTTLNLLGPATGITLDNAPRLGRMLYYCKASESECNNPNWCGAHFDHGMFTALVPAFYFCDGIQVNEPQEAGLFVKTKSDGMFRKVKAQDKDVLMFQVGEFGQLITNDRIRATEHVVRKASGNIERYTMALFFDAPMETVIYSTSQLTQDPRYGGKALDPCSYDHWNAASFKRYIVK